jgi:hypothetical protein
MVLLPAGGYFAFQSLRLLAAGESAPATVTKVTVEKGRDKDRNYESRYAATIAFHAGVTPVTIVRRSTLAVGASCLWPCYRQGQSLRVRYLPAEPSAARVDSVMDLYGLPVMLLLTGTVVLVWGIALLRDFRRRPAFDVTPTWR